MLKDYMKLDLRWSSAFSLLVKAPVDSITTSTPSSPHGISAGSLGASLALMMAYMLPDRFRGLLLIGACACCACAWPEKNLRGFMLRRERDRESFLKEFRALAYPKPVEDSLYLEGAREKIKDYKKLDLRSILPNIKQRTIILHGIEDPIVPFSSSLALYNMIKKV